MLITLVSWFGTFTSILGSFAVANKMFQIGYVLFTLGSMSWLFVGLKRQDRSLALLNGTFFIANLTGLYNFL
jgi:hypothetical protein